MQTFSKIISEIKKSETKRKIALPQAMDESSIEALWEAREIVTARLFGNAEEIRAIIKDKNYDENYFEIVNTENEQESALKAVSSVRNGECHMLMKGKLSTGAFLKSVLNKEYGLRSGGLLSHVMVSEYKGSLIFITDGGMNIAPDLNDLIEITRNALDVAKGSGIENPTAALLSALTESNEVPEAEKIALDMSQIFIQENFPYIFEGALALEDMFYLDTLPDVIVVPCIEAGNLLGKSMIYFHDLKCAGLIAGATAPVIMLSRADDPDTKLNSIALATQIAENQAVK